MKLCFRVTAGVAGALALMASPTAWTCATASPETSLEQAVCAQLTMGTPPGMIAEMLQRGDGRITPFQAQQAVWDAMTECEA